MEAQPEYQPTPPPKKSSAPGAEITFVMPNVVGLPVNQALTVLRSCLLTSESDAAITLDGVADDLSNATDTRLIDTQTPAAGTSTPISTIGLTSSDSEAAVTDIYMPDLTNLSSPAAFAAVDALGALCAAANSGQRFGIHVKLDGAILKPPYPSQFGVLNTNPAYDPSTPLDPGGIVAVVVFDPFP